MLNPKFISFINSKIFFKYLIIIFIISRVFVLFSPPSNYSDVKQDYERYANMWWYGMKPYLQHYYEYPPATIPLLTFPLFLDQLGVGNFYFNYRTQTFIFDLILFYLIIKCLDKFKIDELKKRIALIFYILSGIFAKDFYYDGLDLFFAGLTLISIMTLFLYDNKNFRNRVVIWAVFWWSVAIKFMSFPIIVLLFVCKKLNFKKELIALALGFFIIFLIPIIFYRSSLSVSLVFHNTRHIKYSSVASYLIESINLFTNSEYRVNLAPDFQLEGPISSKFTKIVEIVFPVSVLLVFIYALGLVNKTRNKWIDIKSWINLILAQNSLSTSQAFTFCLKITVIYFTTIFITAKVFSQPFVIWLIPFATVYPFKNVKKQIIYLGSIMLLLVLLTNPILNQFLDNNLMIIKPFNVGFFKSSLRIGVMFIVWFLGLKWLEIRKIKLKT